MRITGYKRREDIDRLMEINDSCYSGIYRPSREQVRDMITVSDVFFARVEQGDVYPLDDIIGFAIVRNTAEPYLWNMAVDPRYQGRGVGGVLLDHLINIYATDNHAITLHVNATNPAQKLYFDHGFRVIWVEPNYFDPHDGLLMKRKLP